MPTCQKEFTLSVTTSIIPVAWWKMEELTGFRVDVVNGVLLDPDSGPTVSRETGLIDFGMGNEGFMDAFTGHETDIKPAPDCSFSITGWFRWSGPSPTLIVIYQIRKFIAPFLLAEFSFTMTGGSNTLDVGVKDNGGATEFTSITFPPATDIWWFWHLTLDPVTGVLSVELRRPDAAERDIGTVSQSGTTITAVDTGSFTADDVGTFIKLDSVANNYLITAFTDDTHVEVDTAAAIATDEATVFGGSYTVSSDNPIFPADFPLTGYINLYNTAGDVGTLFVVDETAIWNFQLTPSQVNFLWNNGVGRTYPF